MSEKLFHIYRSSAGSGKTRTLAKEYLKLALHHRAEYYKHILAVTFANKATQEMKDRILDYLDDFANGRDSELTKELQAELKLDAPTFQMNAQEVQSSILHGYAHFAISTIDAFFQKVIRSFTREAGLTGDYRLEVEHQAVLEEVIDNLIDELGTNEELTKWVVEFTQSNLESERAWDVRTSLIKFSDEIFKEEFKQIEKDLLIKSNQRDFFKNLLNDLRKKKFEFIHTIKNLANEAVTLLDSHGLVEDDFKYRSRGSAFGFLRKMAAVSNVTDLLEKNLGNRARKDFQEAANWPSKDSGKYATLLKLTRERLLPLLQEILNYRDRTFREALSAEVVMKEFYSFGLLSDISRKLKEYKDENNLMLLADASAFLNGIISDSDTPFIYEKVGSFYRNYLIDEFQDTSAYQWKNFLPLVVNGLDQGFPSMVVGDVKQAIYRWRGGDLQLLQKEVEQIIGSHRVEVKELSNNFRSAAALVDFNNSFFKSASQIIANQTSHQLSETAYLDVQQQVARKEVEGYVQINFVEDTEDVSWKDVSLQKLTTAIEEWQEKGVPLSDIAILVRTNLEGQQIVAYLLAYKHSPKAKPNCRYDVISNESLRLEGAASVNLLLSAMRYLANPEDAIARAQLGFEFARLYEKERILTDVFAVTNQVFFENNLPESFSKAKISLRKLPLYELTETLIEIFRLGEQTGELTYLQAFEELVLEFSGRERSDVSSFLEWWNDHGNEKSIQVSGEVNAMQILTIHKSKGLQFPFVVIPFCAWHLDHDGTKGPMLWVNFEEGIFSKAGHIPVRYSGQLKETYFQEVYEQEFARTYLDNLNLLYVAFTRAERGLMVLTNNPKNSSNDKSIAGLLKEAINTPDLAQYWNATSMQWQRGEIFPKETKIKSAYRNAIELSGYPSGAWRDKLIIKQSGKGFFNKKEEPDQRILYGLYMHAVLSRIHYASDLEKTLDQLGAEGYIASEERMQLESQMKELLSNPLIASWFASEWEVRTEVPILLPGGGESRIDRLLLKPEGKKAIVIDFKTGDVNKTDQKQVHEYTEQLHLMGFSEVEGYLLYLRTSEVVSVKSGKAKAEKKNNKNQLGLDF